VVAPATVLRVLRLTGVDQVLDIYPTVQKAVADSAPFTPLFSRNEQLTQGAIWLWTP
jgi:hypothetical protein